MKNRVDALCTRNHTNLKAVCESLDIHYTSCHSALSEDKKRYKNLGKLANYFEVSIEWITEGDIEEIDDVLLSHAYINREMICFDDKLTEAFDELDLLSDKKKREAVTTLVEYYRSMEVTLVTLAEHYLDMEDLLKQGKVAYPKAMFKRIREKLSLLRKETGR